MIQGVFGLSHLNTCLYQELSYEMFTEFLLNPLNLMDVIILLVYKGKSAFIIQS